MINLSQLLSKGTLLSTSLVVLVFSVSCGSDDSGGGGSSGSSGSGAAGSGGQGGGVGGQGGSAAVGGGGAGGQGGSAAVGGGGAGGQGGSGGGMLGPPCCGGIGQCVDGSSNPQAAMNLDQDICMAGLVCAPTTFSDPTYIPPTCTSASNAEGRCVNECFTAGVGAAQFLPQDTCQAGEKCVPCFNPVDGMPTGACDNNGDMPVQPPVTFSDCCANLGKCVPMSLVPPDRAAQLPMDTCTQGDLCAPTVVINDPEHKFAPCTANILFQMHPGACVPACLAGSQAGLLAQETCAQGELCAPCVNPLDMMPTGACS